VEKQEPNSLTAQLAPRPSRPGVYVHVPFCSSICNYCNFNRGLYDEALKTRYVAALRQEIARTGGFRLQAEGSRVGQGFGPDMADTIFFGGGTPSLLEPAEIGAIIESIREHVDLDPASEITLETNPETVDRARRRVNPAEALELRVVK